jgi:hypothetical protein
MEMIMADFSIQQVAATLASGILAATTGLLGSKNSDEQASKAIDVYHECLKQLRSNPEG